MLDQLAEEAAGGRQVEGGAHALEGVWSRLECDHLDVQEVGQLDERHFTCRSADKEIK